MGPDTVDRLWIFPVLEWETRETGLIVVSRYGADDGEREVHTLRFRGSPERADREFFQAELEEEGRVPADRLPRIIAGVSRRLRGEDPGEPEEIAVEGDPEVFDTLFPPPDAVEEPPMTSGTNET